MGKKQSAGNFMAKFKGRRRTGLLVIAFGAVISAVLFMREGSGTGEEIGELQRNEWAEGSSEISLVANDSFGRKEFEFEIPARKLSEEEVSALLPKFEEALCEAVKGDNEDLGSIKGKLCFPEMLEGYPFRVKYSLDPSDYFDRDGNPISVPANGEVITVEAEISYEDYSYLYSFPVAISPEVEGSEEFFHRKLEEAVEKNAADGREDAGMILPTEVNGEHVVWEAKRTGKAVRILIVSLFAGVVIFLSEKYEAVMNDKKRLQEIEEEYPEFISKFAMLVDAGMPIRRAFERIGRTYENGKISKNPLYDEVVIAVRNLSNGVPESNVYDNFAEACKSSSLRRFSNLVCQNLRKGSSGFKEVLKQEADRAVKERVGEVRKAGERASTRLLFPMMMLLVIVMAMIMVPAFGMFSI
ncbi:MAG: type II secretion system F family protein [Lachnospiraceae bacterium]|nr:type II secretion system F family protein [Lachnospiraceae bacterium]